MTSGQRVPLWGDLRGRIQRLHRRISRFAHEARKQFSIEVVYRGTEFTVDEVLSFHVHANVLFAPRSALPARRWEEFLRWTRRFFGAHFQDSRLEKPREAIKYSFKPAELEWLEGPALAWVYHETRGLKLAQPLGDFAEFWRELDRRGLKVLLVDGPEGVRVRPVAKQGRPSSTRERRAGLRRDESAPENEILCQMAPQSRFSPYAEPVLLVRNYTTNPKTWEGLVRLEEINEHRRRAQGAMGCQRGARPGVAGCNRRAPAIAQRGTASGLGIGPVQQREGVALSLCRWRRRWVLRRRGADGRCARPGGFR